MKAYSRYQHDKMGADTSKSLMFASDSILIYSPGREKHQYHRFHPTAGELMEIRTVRVKVGVYNPNHSYEGVAVTINTSKSKNRLACIESSEWRGFNQAYFLGKYYFQIPAKYTCSYEVATLLSTAEKTMLQRGECEPEVKPHRYLSIEFDYPEHLANRIRFHNGRFYYRSLLSKERLISRGEDDIHTLVSGEESIRFQHCPLPGNPGNFIILID